MPKASHPAGKKIEVQNKEVSSASAEQMLRDIHKRNSSYWTQKREANALKLFHEAAERVPAYKDFLKKHKISPDSIKTFEDFQKVPITTKENYLKQYPLEKLCWDGTLDRPLVFTSTSGSTGEPFYFCRSNKLDWQYSVIHELFFNNSDKKSTLVLICFGMGVWIGGLITYQAFEMMSNRGYPISILTTGINKEEIFKALKKLAPNFEQVILCGYPPFIKDIVDEAPSRGIKLKDLNVRLLFAAEAFTEPFRDYLGKKLDMKNVCLDTMNIYGSAEIGAMAFENPLSILLRRLALKRPEVFKSIFGDINKTPTFAQYNSSFITFESPNGEILLTGDNSLPLVRYSIGDQGGTYTFTEIANKLAQFGISIYKEAQAEGLIGHLYQLPFVHVFERADLSTTLYGLQVYPETIREVLIENPFNSFLTGKFTLITKFDDKQNQYLEVNLELQKNKEATPVLQAQLSSSIIKNLLEKSSEYNELYHFIGERAYPKLVFWPAEDPTYFRPGVKQMWVKK
jgi:phenylacetate-CoA ligase